MAQVTVDKPIQTDVASEETPANRWWAIMDTRIGIVPVPVFVVVVGLLAAYVRLGAVPADLTTNILTLTVGGFACAELGKHLLAISQRADQAHGYLEQGIGLAEEFNKGVGKASFTEDLLRENLTALMDAVVRAKPPAAKGQYLKSVTLAPTMGPGVRLDVAPTLALTAAAT